MDKAFTLCVFLQESFDGSVPAGGPGPSFQCGNNLDSVAWGGLRGERQHGGVVVMGIEGGKAVWG